MNLKEKKILKKIHSLSKSYIKKLQNPNSPVTQYQTPFELKKKENLKITNKGEGLNQLLHLSKTYLENSVLTGSENFYNQLFSGFSLPGYVGEILTALNNTSMYTYEVAPMATLIEKELIKTMSDLIGFKNKEGTFVTGGSNANFIALFMARNYFDTLIKKRGINPKKNLIFFVSDQAHYSFEKAANLLGLGSQSMTKIKTNKKGEMIPEVLEKEILKSKKNKKTPFFIGATAGTTVLGAFDPIEKIAKLCHQYKVWFHIDGAWGGSVILSKKHKSLLKGCEMAHSFAWDAHKMMGIPLICSVLLVNKAGLLKSINETTSSEYLFHDTKEEFDLGHLSIQCGRRVDSLKLWLAWKCYGHDGFEKKIDSLFEIAEYTKNLIEKDSNFELVKAISSINICFRHKNKALKTEKQLNDHNLNIRNQLIKEGKAFVNYSMIEKKISFRLIIVNFNLSKKSIETLIKYINEIGERLV